MYKKCNKCETEKLFSDFHKDKTKKDGCRTTCKICKSDSDKNYKKNNKELCKLRDVNYYLKNKEIHNLRSKAYYEENKERLVIIQNEYNEGKKDFLKEYRKKYYDDSKYTPEYRRKYREYYENNKASFMDRAAKRRAAKLNAVPSWITKEQLAEIKDLYTIAQMFKLYTGEEYHVDHIVPLQGDNVCGLHVPWNLQVIPAKENLSKSNKHEG